MSKDFDKIFKSKLENHGSSYPADMWENIDAAINPPKRNTRFLWFTFLFIAVIGTVSGVLVLRDADNHNQLTNLQQEDISLSDNSITQLSPSDSKMSNVIEIAEKLVVSNVQVNDADTSQDIYAAKNVTETQKRSENLQKNTYPNAFVATEETSSATGMIKANENKARNRRKITFTEPLLSVDTKSQGTECADPNLYAKVGLSTTSINYTTEFNTIVNPWNNTNASISQKSISTINISSLPSLAQLKYQESRPLKDMELSVVASRSTDCPSWVREKLGLYLEAYYAPEYGVRSLTAKDRDSTIIAHQNSRNDTEEALISYSLGARALFLTPSGISFKLGLNYAQINERFTWQDPESIREITIVDTDPMTGDTLNTYVTYEYGTDVEERINRYKSIDLSLLVGYEKHYRKKLSFSVNAGIYLNLIAKQRGMFIDPDGNRSWFSSDDGSYDAYKRSIGVSFFASGGLMYHWVDGIDFFAEPSLRFYTQSMTLNDYPLNQNYVVLGIHTGIRYKF